MWEGEREEGKERQGPVFLALCSVPPALRRGSGVSAVCLFKSRG